MATTLNGIDLEKIQDWRNNKEGNITPIPLPGDDSEGTDVIDMLGVIEFIEITGRLSGNFAAIQAKLASLKGLVNGNQGVSFNLSSPYVITNSAVGSFAVPLTIKVKVGKFNYTWELPGMSYVDYSIQLVIGK
jgi:hypothetical protein